MTLYIEAREGVKDEFMRMGWFRCRSASHCFRSWRCYDMANQTGLFPSFYRTSGSVRWPVSVADPVLNAHNVSVQTVFKVYTATELYR